MSDHQIPPGFEGLDELQFNAMVNVLKMLVLLGIPEDRRQTVLSLLERTFQSRLETPDAAPIDQAMLSSVRELRDTGASLSALERLIDYRRGSSPGD